MMGFLASGLLAEAEPMGGWGNLILQGGAFGLLTYIVVWMYPRAQTEARQEREKRDTAFADLTTKMQDRFESRNLMLVSAIESQTDKLAKKLDEQSIRQAHGIAAALSDVIRQIHEVKP